jgi:hypothetical protein
MGIFSRKTETAAFASAPVQAAAGASQIGQFNYYLNSNDEARALSSPTISRSRDLIAGMVGALELRHYTKQWTGERYEKIYLPLEPWMERPDPKVSRSFFYVNIFSDLYFHGIAYAYIQTRYSTGLPASFTWLPAASVSSPDQSGYLQYFGQQKELMFNGQSLDVSNVLQFISPTPGLLKIGNSAINTQLYLNAAADRYAQLETVPGYLQQVSGEDMSGEDLGDLATQWAAARRKNAIGALSSQVQFKEFSQNAQETNADQRKYQDLTLSRLCNVPPYLLGIDTGSYQYQTSVNAREDLYLFGARMYLDTIEQTLSSEQVLPRNRFVEFDIESYIGVSDMSREVMPEYVDEEESIPS